MNLIPRIASFVATFILLVGPSALFAQSGGLVSIVPDSCKGDGGCQSICDVATLAQNVMNDAIYFAIAASSIFFVVAGFQYMFAAGDPYKIKGAKKVFQRVVIGLLIIMTAWVIVHTVLNTLTGQTGWQWNRVCGVR